MKRIFNLFFWLYIINIIAFGTAYWIIGNVKPASFILNKEYNVNPFADTLELNEQFFDLDLTDYYSRIKNIKGKISSIENEQIELIRNDSITKFKVDSLYEINKGIREKNIDEYERNKENNSIYTKQKDEIQYIIDSIKNVQTDDKFEEIDNNIKVAKLEVDLAYKKYAISNERLQTAEFIVSNMAYFSDNKILSRIFELQDTERKIESDIYSLSRQLDTLSTDYRTISQNCLTEQRKRLSYFDFIYFSSANSSTVTFGEIIPNTKTIRFLLMIQVIISLALFGGYIKKLFKE